MVDCLQINFPGIKDFDKALVNFNKQVQLSQFWGIWKFIQIQHEARFDQVSSKWLDFGGIKEVINELSGVELGVV